MEDQDFMSVAIELAKAGVEEGLGGPFGAVVVKEGVIIGRGQNRVLADADPTAHAEVVAIREACAHLGSFQLDGCTLYTSCEPCPMCLGAIYWARPARMVYACTRHDASAVGFDDGMIYEELNRPMEDRRIPTQQCMRNESLEAMALWARKTDKTEY
jgi:tRNA(Arg) A34 adenosine deaminase TadA